MTDKNCKLEGQIEEVRNLLNKVVGEKHTLEDRLIQLLKEQETRKDKFVRDVEDLGKSCDYLYPGLTITPVRGNDDEHYLVTYRRVNPHTLMGTFISDTIIENGLKITFIEQNEEKKTVTLHIRK